MPLNSINTNAQSLIALQSLNTTNNQLSITQKRVSTGFRVSDARDDGGAFAVAQTVRSDMAGVVAVNEQLGGVKGILETTFAALSVVSDTMKQLRATLTRLADGAISVEQRNTYEEQYKLLAAQVSSFVDDAFYNGRTLLSTSALSGGGDITAIRNETGGLFTVQAVDGAGVKLNPNAFPPQPSTANFETGIKAELAVGFELADPIGWAAKTGAQKTTDINTAFAALTPAQKQTRFDDNAIRSELAAELQAADPVAWAAKTPAQKTTDTNTAFVALTPAQKEARIDARVLAERIAQAKSMIQTDGEFNSTQTEISKALNRFGAAMAFVENQIGYNSKKVDSMTSGMGALVDADLARESSTLEALKVRQQLGVQTLGLANQGPQVLLGLFR
jgi:flagellin-like hook-associated protein FlgL